MIDWDDDIEERMRHAVALLEKLRAGPVRMSEYPAQTVRDAKQLLARRTLRRRPWHNGGEVHGLVKPSGLLLTMSSATGKTEEIKALVELEPAPPRPWRTQPTPWLDPDRGNRAQRRAASRKGRR